MRQLSVTNRQPCRVENDFYVNKMLLTFSPKMVLIALVSLIFNTSIYGLPCLCGILE